MAKLDLSTMPDAQYKALSAVDLMKYNKSMPEIDYDNPYLHQPYPRTKFKKERMPDGSEEIVSAIAATKEIEEQLGPEWKNSPLDFGVETHPAAAKIPVERIRIPVPAREAIDPAPASTTIHAAPRK